jgi:hypothetical protein
LVSSNCCVVAATEGVIGVCVTAGLMANGRCVVATAEGVIVLCVTLA